MLYPVNNPRRIALSLDGIWNFAPVADDYRPIEPLAISKPVGVPSSVDEIFADDVARDHVGRFVFERAVAFPAALCDMAVAIRVGAGGNRAEVYLDGLPAGRHEGAFLPYDVAVPAAVVERGEARLTIVLDNRLDFATLPIGEVEERDGRRFQRYNHDFLNATGIHRSVLLVGIPPTDAIRDIRVSTSGHETVATVDYEVETDATVVRATVFAPDGTKRATASGRKGSMTLADPLLWDVGCGNLHVLRIETATDRYELPFGIRDVELRDGAFLLNGKPVRFRGFGMHEDHAIVGKATIPALLARDFDLLGWIGANSFRTSHYPYAELMLELADRLGILVIDEVPAVGMNYWSARPVFVPGTVDGRTLAVHKAQLTEMIARDRNHPSVVMVSVANEATTHEDGAVPYFTDVFRHARTLTSLPLMIVLNGGAAAEKVAGLADVIGLNRYTGWYVDPGDLAAVPGSLRRDLAAFRERFGKPILVTEFGADTIAGLHRLPAAIFSEEYQAAFLKTYHETLAPISYVIGEHVWNFADFLTKQGITRVDGNKKGVFTRDRQPKLAAHVLRELWKKA